MRRAVLVPCYKRPEYTMKCIVSLERSQEYVDTDFYLIDDGSNDGTYEILSDAKLNSIVITRAESSGLRNTIIDFFELIKNEKYEYIAKMDNDCIVPKNWLNDLINVLETTDADIVSPNVMPSNAAFHYGTDSNKGYRPSEFVGGLWCMKAKLIKDVYFERFSPNGISGAHNLLKQIVVENEAKVGWVPEVVVDDIGHWSGTHPEHIKSEDHRIYSAEIGRGVSW